MPDAGDAKVCIRCGQDCSGKPRTKDAQGRYLCRECLEKLRAKRPDGAPEKLPAKASASVPKAAVAAPPVDTEGSVLSSLLSDSPDPCPSCAAPMAKDAVICAFCGFNKQTGEAAKTRISRAPKEKAVKGPRPSISLEFSPMWTFGGSVLLLGGLFGLAQAQPDMAMLYLGVLALYGLVAWILMIVWAFMDEDTVWGIVGIIAGVFGCLQLAMLYYVFGVSERGQLKAMILSYVVGVCLFIALYAQNPELLQRFR